MIQRYLKTYSSLTFAVAAFILLLILFRYTTSAFAQTDDEPHSGTIPLASTITSTKEITTESTLITSEIYLPIIDSISTHNLSLAEQENLEETSTDRTVDGSGSLYTPDETSIDMEEDPDIALEAASVNAILPVDTPSATLEEFWNGQASWKLVREWNYNTGYTGWTNPEIQKGSHIKIVGNNWYLFHGKYYNNAKCNGFGSDTRVKQGIQVRKSTNKGATWSAPKVILEPSGSGAWGCVATDGDAYYLASQQKWIYLFQCQNQSNAVWNGCYAEFSGSDPTAGTQKFTPPNPNPNPVVNSGELWNQICNSSSDHCVSIPGGTGKVKQEGTFNIFKYDGQYYWISFHGAEITNQSYNGQTVIRGYRGIAKTANFNTWIAGSTSSGVPSDAILDKNDAVDWRENWRSGGNIGGGKEVSCMIMDITIWLRRWPTKRLIAHMDKTGIWDYSEAVR